jgi:hypothetical protein
LLLTLLLFAAASAAIVLVWNRLFAPVSLPVAVLLWSICAAYLGPTLFTSCVDVPGNLAFVAYPWLATGRPAVKANTGIIFTQIAPWTRIARDALLSGEPPLWNRASASGAPLLANQQTAIYHPFTLLGLLLPLGKAFTLSAALRLFTLAFFTFLLLRNWEISTGASIFGALAYAFSSFHIIWLLFPLGLSTMMLPLCLVGVQEIARGARSAAYALLIIGLTLAVLGGHPESALWVWIATMLLAIHSCTTARMPWGERMGRLAVIASAFVFAMLLSAFFWYPTLTMLRLTTRYQAVRSLAANPADHELSHEWLLPLIVPNVLGNPVNGTYRAPRGFHPAVLNDYGEVASGYAGLATLGLALAAPFARRRRPLGIAVALMVVSLMTFAEAPLWRDLIRMIPLVGISIHQRLRIFWDLGTSIAAALTLDAAIEGERRREIGVALLAVLTGVIVIYAVRHPGVPGDRLALAQLIVPSLTTMAVLVLIWRRWSIAAGVTALVLVDLIVATYRYNPPARPADLYPVTGAIARLQRAEKPFRMAAWGWSFLPDTPGYYGIEDIKTTDPIQHAGYMRLMKGYLNADPASYDQLLRDASQPFFDYLNIKYVYVPPDQSLSDHRFVEIYRGPDGVLLENTRVVPRYFLVSRFSVDPSFDHTLGRSREIGDYRIEALVDHVPGEVLRAQPLLSQPVLLRGGNVRIRKYGDNATLLDVTSDGWNLLVTSDVHWPGWHACWNGQRQPPVTVNGAFLGCFIPPGKGRLELRYQPDELTNGLRASGVGIAILLVLGIAAGVRNGRARRHARAFLSGQDRQ